MKKRFENSALIYVIFGFLVVKFLCTALYPYVDLPLKPFAYQLLWTPLMVGSVLDTVSNLALVLNLCIYVSAALFVAMSILFLMNRQGAGFAAVAVMVFCILDLIAMLPLAFFGSAIYSLVNVIFNLPVILMLLSLLCAKKKAPKF